MMEGIASAMLPVEESVAGAAPAEGMAGAAPTQKGRRVSTLVVAVC